MEEEQETKFCSNCKKDIPAINFMMHVPHCQRNIILCDVCQEPVPKSQKDEHFEECHAEVKCECGELMEKRYLDEHKEKDCKSRKTNCQYCELECTVGEIDSHKEYCGSRTELCEKCNRRIQHRDLEEHLQTDCTLNNNKPMNNNATNGPSTLQDGFRRTLPEEMEHNFGFGHIDDVALAGGPELLNFHQILASGIGTLPLGNIFEEEQYFGNRNVFSSDVLSRGDIVARGPPNNRRQREPRRERNRDNGTRIDDRAAVRQDLENDELMAALLACADDDERTDGGNYAGLKEPLPGINDLQANHDTHLSDDQDADLDETILPCEFCGELIKAQDLIQHQTGCQLTSAGSPSLYPQLRSQPRSLPPLRVPDSSSDDDQEHNGTIGNHDETFLPCEFCQELFSFDLLIGHQSICDPDRSRPPSAIHTLGGGFFESDQQGLNNSPPPRTRTRPPRPSRPVAISEQDMNLFHPASDLRSTRKVTSNDEGSGVSFNPAGELHSFGGTYPNDDDNSSNNSSSSNSNRGNHNNNSNSSRYVALGNARSQRNNEVHSGPRGSPHSVPLTVRNGQASQGAAMDNQDRRKTTSKRLSKPARVSSDDIKEECVIALPRRSSPKVTSTSRHGDGSSGLKESGKNSLNDNEMSALSVNGRHWKRSEDEGNELTWEMRPLQETGAWHSATANQRPPRKGISSSGHPFQHSTETRKQMARLAPSFDNQPKSTDSRKEVTRDQARAAKKVTSSGRNEQRTSERGARGASSRTNSSKKSKSNKKIV